MITANMFLIDSITQAMIMGFLLDMAVGDPRFIPHPVRFIGFLTVKWEKLLKSKQSQPERKDIFKGALLTVCVVISVCFPLIIILKIADTAGVYTLVSGLVFWLLIASKGLKTESMKIYNALTKEVDNDQKLLNARKDLAMIVGRDTDHLNEEKIVKAAVETVSENATDAVIAPMIFFAVLGPLGICFYKAVNTLDSMIGYKNTRYIYMGRAAARLDDLLNFVPAMAAAYLMLAAAYIFKMDYKNGYRIYKRDRYNHSSPNSAKTESVCAGILGIQLGGGSTYGGRMVEKPFIGDNMRKAVPEDIKTACRLMTASGILGLLFCVAVRIIFNILGGIYG